MPERNDRTVDDWLKLLFKTLNYLLTLVKRDILKEYEFKLDVISLN